MAITTFTGDLSAFFAAGTSLEARPASNWPAIQRPPAAGTTPVGVATATATSNSSGVMSFSGLADSTEYYVSDAAGTRYVRITTFPERQELMSSQANQPNGYPKLNALGDVPGADLPQSLAVDVDEYQIAAASFSAGVQAAITAATAAGTKRGAIACTPGKTYINDGDAISLAANVPGLIVYGNGATVKGTSHGSARRCFDLTRVADNDTFSGYDIRDLTFDRDNLTSVTNEHVFFGTLVGGSWARRINVSDVALRRCKTKNVPTSLAVAYQNVSIGSQHLTSGEGTTNTIVDVLVEDCDWQGGTYGTVPAFGGCNSVTAGQGVEIMYDRITVRNTKHDTGVVPTTTGGGANIQIGGYAWGRKATIENCYGANSPDEGIEVDNCLNLVIDSKTVMVDSFTSPFFIRNFRKPGAGTSPEIQQRNEVYGTAINRSVDPVPSGGSVVSHFRLGGDATVAGYNFGHAIFKGKSVCETAMVTGGSAGQVVDARSGSSGNGVNFRQLTVDIDMDCPNMVINTAANQSPTYVDIRSLLAGHVVNVEGVNFKWAGSRAGVGVFTWKPVRIAGNDGTVKVDSIAADIGGLSGLTTANDVFNWIAFGTDFSGTILKGQVNGLRMVTAPSGGTHHGLTVASTTTLALTGLLNVTNFDLEKLAGLSGFDYNVDSTQLGKVAVRNYATSSSRAGGVGNSVASPGSGKLTVPPAGEWIDVTGTNSFTGINKTWKGRKFTLRFNGVLTITGDGNLVLAGGSYVSSNNGTLPLVSDGTSLFEDTRR